MTRQPSDLRQQFDERGFVVIPDVLKRSEVAALKRRANLRFRRRGPRSPGGIHEFSIATRVGAVWDLMVSPQIVSTVAELIGPNVQVHHSKLAKKPRRNRQASVAFHQDFAFTPHTNASIVSAFVYLDDATRANGCMQMISGSHKRGPLPHHDENGSFVGSFVGTVAGDDCVDIEASAGSVSFHHGLTLHGSLPRSEGSRRPALIFMYRACDAAQLGGPRFDETGVVVAGAFNGRVRCEVDDVQLPPGSHDMKRDPAPDLYGVYDLSRGSLGRYSSRAEDTRRQRR